MSQATATVPFSCPPLTDVFGQLALYEVPVLHQCQVTRVNWPTRVVLDYKIVIVVTHNYNYHKKKLIIFIGQKYDLFFMITILIRITEMWLLLQLHNLLVYIQKGWPPVKYQHVQSNWTILTRWCVSLLHRVTSLITGILFKSMVYSQLAPTFHTRIIRNVLLGSVVIILDTAQSSSLWLSDTAQLFGQFGQNICSVGFN